MMIRAVVGALVSLCASSAFASSYFWTFSVPFNGAGGGNITGSGILTAQDTISTGYDFTYTGYLVTSFSGTFDGGTILGLDPVDTYALNDNLIFTSDQLLDEDGVSFTVSGANHSEIGPDAEIFYSSFGPVGYTMPPADIGSNVAGFTLIPVTAPEPASIAFLMAGLAGAIAPCRRCRAAVQAQR